MLALNSKLRACALATVLAAALAAPAHAATVPPPGVTPLYSGGSVIADRVYRDLFNCYGNHSGIDTIAGLVGNATRCNLEIPYTLNVEPLYVGSGNAKITFLNHDASHFTDGPVTPDAAPVPSTTHFGPFYGTGVGAIWVPGSTDAGPFFPTVSFVGNDEPWSAADITTYNSVSGGHWGAPIQVPALITTVAIAFQPTKTWNEKGVPVFAASSAVNLTTDTLCGIFTGAITNWSDNAFKSANGGLQLGSGPITVVYRRGGGGTFLLSNALTRQCAFTTHPVPATWQNAAGNTSGLGNDQYFANLSSAHLLPANFVALQSGQTMQATIKGIAGAIGYDVPDSIMFMNPVGDEAANLQTFASIGKTPVFLAPIGRNTPSIVAKTAPPSSLAASCDAAHATGVAPFILSDDGICVDNPLNWGMTFAAPASSIAYPIGGLSFINAYTCYSTASARDTLAGTLPGSLGLLRWFYGTSADNKSEVKVELNRNGFSALPGSWISAVKKLLTVKADTKIGIPGQLKTGCATVTGGA